MRLHIFQSYPSSFMVNMVKCQDADNISMPSVMRMTARTSGKLTPR